MKIGIVGHGSIGSRHARNLATLGHRVTVYDPANQKDVKFERQLYDSDVEAVVIATPSLHHSAAIRACVERGKHMLIEKPISLDTNGLLDLLQRARDKNLVTMMGNNLRFHPCIRKTKQWIADGSIGKPIWAHFTCAAKSTKALYLSDGVVLNTGSHEVDIALHLFGPARVLTANCVRVGTDETIADFLLEHWETGVRSSFHLDFVTQNEIREAWIVGDIDRIGIELRNRNVSLGAHAEGCGGSYDDDYIEEVKAFVRQIETGEDCGGATGEDGLRALDVLMSVRRMGGLWGLK